MFRNRNTSQKPSDELVANFKASFPHLRTTQPSEQPSLEATSLTDALDVASSSRELGDEHNGKELEPTSRGGPDQWRFTPSLLDPNSFAFSSFANQPPGYYTPTPGGTNTLYHPQAGDLHTPGFTIGIGTPLSMPTSDGAVQTSHVAHAPIPSFHNAGVPPNLFHNADPFSAFPQSHQPQHHYPAPNFHSHHSHPHHHSIDLGRPQQYQHQSQIQHSSATFNPQSFSHQNQGFESFPQHHENSGQLDHANLQLGHGLDLTEHSPILQQAFAPAPVNLGSQASQQHLPEISEHFRYHVTLNAPTAMIKSSDEIPVTYLNKGQAYTIAVTDTLAHQANMSHIGQQYRTYVRVSFEDEQQRQKPAACWQLWKEGRGTNEAHHRGGRLQAVEYVDPGQTGAGLDNSSKPHFELEHASFDGFSVLWTPPINGPAECNITVRFNFLSTDFSHSKGVKGIPVRLCAKTELKSASLEVADPLSSSAEVCFCKVKLFRDHGAERKLSNDIAHVKKSIDKLKQQITQAESGVKDSGKRKRSNSISRTGSSNPRPTKVAKHKRTWSMSSEASVTGGTGHRGSHEEDLQTKLQALQDMFTSTRPSSVLCLRGEDLDDPDLHPVQLTGGDQPPELLKVETGESSNLERHSSASNISPTPSSLSMPPIDRQISDFPRPSIPPSRMTSDEWQSLSQTATGDLQMTTEGAIQTSSSITKITRRSTTGSFTSGTFIEATGVDSAYQPPQERIIKPVACFFFKLTGPPPKHPHLPQGHLYRAVYLMQRTLGDLVYQIATKSGVEPSKVLRTLRVNKANIEIMFDDDMVIELPEGQDMTLEYTEVVTEEPVKQEWSSGLPEVLVDGDIDSAQTTSVSGYEMRLHF